MRDFLRLRAGRFMFPIPRVIWRRMVAKDARRISKRLDFMSADHHRVRNFVVAEIARVPEPLPPERIAERLELPLPQVQQLLDDLERNMTFLYRGGGRRVTWAYPVTVDRTPHRIVFDTGERVHAA